MNEPAFPVTAPNGDIYSGMTLRDYFAAKAMQGMLANPNRDYTFAGAATDAYEWADAMMQARKNGGKDESTSADAALDEMEFKNIALRGMVETRDTEIARLTDLNTAKGELIDFYTNYLSGISGYLATHQMSPSEAQVEYGNTLRARIRSLENE